MSRPTNLIFDEISQVQPEERIKTTQESRSKADQAPQMAKPKLDTRKPRSWEIKDNQGTYESSLPKDEWPPLSRARTRFRVNSIKIGHTQATPTQPSRGSNKNFLLQDLDGDVNSELFVSKRTKAQVTDLVKYMKQHRYCQFCPRTFKDSKKDDALWIHGWSHFTVHACLDCGFLNARYDYFAQHHKRDHPNLRKRAPIKIDKEHWAELVEPLGLPHDFPALPYRAPTTANKSASSGRPATPPAQPVEEMPTSDEEEAEVRELLGRMCRPPLQKLSPLKSPPKKKSPVPRHSSPTPQTKRSRSPQSDSAYFTKPRVPIISKPEAKTGHELPKCYKSVECQERIRKRRAGENRLSEEDQRRVFALERQLARKEELHRTLSIAISGLEREAQDLRQEIAILKYPANTY